MDNFQGTVEDDGPVLRRYFHPSQYMAFSTQCVGSGPQGRIPLLARCTVVDYRGQVVYDYYVQPIAPVTNYFTATTGLTASLPDGALTLAQAQADITQQLLNKIVVGHELHNSLSSVGVPHRTIDTRDVGLYLPFRAALGYQDTVPLPVLCSQLMRRTIQYNGVFDPIEDARAAMDLFRTHEDTWEASIASGVWLCCLPPPSFAPYLL
ncbi:hypothetical protein FRB94_014051 [Tulasnella sp. JGI-2019a]|nr:hypothetical protein FRB94_014051 [Tulasnella sp. JGI-2019a]KAG9034931.1 hypothetical protein FRB95_012347 [Tulasnella sp. JGI-2019a]